MRASSLSTGLLFGLVLTCGGCFGLGPPPAPETLACPQPIRGNSGAYKCPYTTDGVAAKWVDMAIAAKAGSQIGQTAGTIAAEQAFKQVPFVGGILGGMAGKEAGRQVAIAACGGEAKIRDTSDLSFNNVDTLAVYIYVKYSSSPRYAEVLDAAQQIYPDLKDRYLPALHNAPRKSAAGSSHGH